MIMKPLSTSNPLSKEDLVNRLQEADIPDDAECTLHFNEDTGVLSLWFYWSEDAGAFGETVIDFDIEREEVIKEVTKFGNEHPEAQITPWEAYRRRKEDEEKNKGKEQLG